MPDRDAGDNRANPGEEKEGEELEREQETRREIGEKKYNIPL